MLCYFVPSSIAGLLSLAIRRVEALIYASMLKVCVAALESIFSSGNTSISELGSHIASKNSESEAVGEIVESTEGRLLFRPGRWQPHAEQVQSCGPKLREVEGARDAAKAIPSSAESNIQPFTAPQSALRGEVGQIARGARELEVEVA